jgi:hypothetical protein
MSTSGLVSHGLLPDVGINRALDRPCQVHGGRSESAQWGGRRSGPVPRSRLTDTPASRSRRQRSVWTEKGGTRLRPRTASLAGSAALRYPYLYWRTLAPMTKESMVSAFISGPCGAYIAFAAVDDVGPLLEAMQDSLQRYSGACVALEAVSPSDAEQWPGDVNELSPRVIIGNPLTRAGDIIEYWPGGRNASNGIRIFNA